MISSICVAVTFATPASAVDEDGWSELSEAERVDLALIAKTEGIGIDEAVERFAWQNDFALASTALQEAHPQSFAYAEITSEAPAAATISFVGPVPADTDKFLGSLPEGIHVELVPGAALSAVDVDAEIIEVHHAVSATGLVGNVLTLYDRGAGLVRVTAEPRGEGDLPGQEQAIRSMLPENLPPFDFILDPQVGGSDDVRRGGGRLEFPDTADLACSGGFNVIKPNGTTGVATAGHCDNSLTHENTNGDPEVDLNFQAQHRGEWGDFQWHKSPEGESDNFYYDYNSTRDVIAWSNPVDGQTLCRFGHKTGATCSAVNDLSVCKTDGDGNELCRLVRMNEDEAGPGDSGGPWYYGQVAYGYHQGSVGRGCGFLGLSSCDVWSRASYIDNALDVSVRSN
jgi:hypothetical protein